MSRFYIYELIDPRDGAVFYVGKGSGRRIHNHEAEARRGAHSRKCERIREIWAAGSQVVHAVVYRFTDENDALQAEFHLIERHGLDLLTNVFPGGVLGADAYLARKADLESRKAEAENRALTKGFFDLAPKFAGAIRAKANAGGFGAMVNGRWIEFGDAFESLFHDMIKVVGFDAAKEAMAPLGVNLIQGTP